MIGEKKKLALGIGMMVGFVIVLIIFFSPLWGGQNGLDYLDNLYNSISKGSAYYIPKVKGESDLFNGTPVTVSLNMDNGEQAEQTALLFKAGGALVQVADSRLAVKGDLGKVLANCLSDADSMYHNDGRKVKDKYGYDERAALYNWWKALKAMEKDLQKQKLFKEAKIADLVVKKAVESSYNYYRIDPQKIGDRWGIVLFSLIFYVVYTMWYGFAFMYLFEGFGLQLEH